MKLIELFNLAGAFNIPEKVMLAYLKHCTAADKELLNYYLNHEDLLISKLDNRQNVVVYNTNDIAHMNKPQGILGAYTWHPLRWRRTRRRPVQRSEEERLCPPRDKPMVKRFFLSCQGQSAHFPYGDNSLNPSVSKLSQEEIRTKKTLVCPQCVLPPACHCVSCFSFRFRAISATSA